MVKEPRWGAIKDPLGYAKRMSEKERIDFIREYGSEQQRETLESILNGNKYKVDKEMSWKETKKGILPVRTIVAKRIGKFDLNFQKS